MKNVFISPIFENIKKLKNRIKVVAHLRKIDNLFYEKVMKTIFHYLFGLDH